MKVLAYVIESGWENNPFWYCSIKLGESDVVEHLHTTQRLGDAPSVFSGKTSGILFIARGCSYPIESREGRLQITESEKPLESISYLEVPYLEWKDIPIEDVIELLQSA